MLKTAGSGQIPLLDIDLLKGFDMVRDKEDRHHQQRSMPGVCELPDCLFGPRLHPLHRSTVTLVGSVPTASSGNRKKGTES